MTANKYKMWVVLLTIFFVNHLSAQHDFKFQIKDLRISQCVFGYYLGSEVKKIAFLPVDTFSGNISYQTNEDLQEGIYFLQNTEGGNILDFLVEKTTTNKNFTLTLETSFFNPIDSAKVSRSAANELYYDYMKKNRKLLVDIKNAREAIERLREMTTDAEIMGKQNEFLQTKLKKLDSLSIDFQQKNPNALFSKVLHANTPPSVPADLKPTNADKKPNPAYVHYYRQHFFDNIDFSDERLLRTKVYDAQLSRYFLQMLTPNTDSIKRAADALLSRLRSNKAFFNYTLRRLLFLFDVTEKNMASLARIPDADAIVVYLVDTYANDLEAATDLAMAERAKYRANLLRPMLIGATFPNVTLPKVSDNTPLSSSASSSKFTLVLFYDPDCSHCKEALPYVENAVNQFINKGLNIYPIINAPSEVAKDFIKGRSEMTAWQHVYPNSMEAQRLFDGYLLPVMFLLDKDKKIIAKRIKGEQLENILEKFIKQ